jgi:hypothetical protein
MQELVNANSSSLKVAASPREKVLDAVMLNDAVVSPYKATDDSVREVYHVHDQESSMHITLAPQDCITGPHHSWL